jgi:hypothetical protein
MKAARREVLGVEIVTGTRSEAPCHLVELRRFRTNPKNFPSLRLHVKQKSSTGKS